MDLPSAISASGKTENELINDVDEITGWSQEIDTQKMALLKNEWVNYNLLNLKAIKPRFL